MQYLDQFGNYTDKYYGYVYITLDQKHNLIYVGRQKGKPESKKNISYFGSGTIISRIINKNGTYFLKKTILGVCYTLEELKACEKECKFFFNAFDRKYGYNIAIDENGGDTLTYLSEEEKENRNKKMLETRRKNGNWFPSKESNLKRSKSCKNKKISKSSIEKRTKTRKERNNYHAWNKNLTKENDKRVAKYVNSNTGKKRTKEYCKYMSIIMKGKKCSKEAKQKIKDCAENKKREDYRLIEKIIKNINIQKNFYLIISSKTNLCEKRVYELIKKYNIKLFKEIKKFNIHNRIKIKNITNK